MRTFDARDGKFLGKRYEKGDYEQAFASYLNNATGLKVSRQPNLERECRSALPPNVFKELQQQIEGVSQTNRKDSMAR